MATDTDTEHGHGARTRTTVTGTGTDTATAGARHPRTSCRNRDPYAGGPGAGRGRSRFPWRWPCPWSVTAGRARDRGYRPRPTFRFLVLSTLLRPPRFGSGGRGREGLRVAAKWVKNACTPTTITIYLGRLLPWDRMRRRDQVMPAGRGRRAWCAGGGARRRFGGMPVGAPSGACFLRTI